MPNSNSFVGGIHPLNLEFEHDEIVKAAKVCTDFAVTEENQKRNQDNRKMELLKIVKVCVQPVAGLNFYITLEAKNTLTGDITAYQTRVYRHFLGGHEVKLFRLRSEPMLTRKLKGN